MNAVAITTSTAARRLSTAARNVVSIDSVIDATRFGPRDIAGKEHWRIIGTTDVEGKGTTHTLAAADPFIFLDESVNPAGKEGLGGGGHPHAGLTAITYLAPDNAAGMETSQGALKAWDNHGGFVKDKHEAGGLYVIETGQGVVHDEHNVTPAGSMHQIQLWVDPGLGAVPTEEQGRAAYQLHQPADIPVVPLTSADGAVVGQVRVMLGSQRGVSSPATAPIPMTYLHATLAPGAATTLSVPSCFSGVVYVLGGEAEVGSAGASAGATMLRRRQVGTFRGSGDSAGGEVELPVANASGDAELQILVAAGQPQESGDLAKLDRKSVV